MWRTILHLIRLVWRQSGAYARIIYGAAIVLPGLFSRPIAQAIQGVPLMRWGLDRILGEGEIIHGIPWDVAVLIAILAVMAWTIWGLAKTTLQYERELEPALSIGFDRLRGGVVPTPIKIKNLDGSTRKERRAIYIRGWATPKSKRMAKNCVPYVTEVKIKHPDGSYAQCTFYESLQLPWANFGLGPIDIPPTVTGIFDIVLLDQRSPVPRLATKWPLYMRELFSFNATYLLTLTVSSEGTSEQMKVEVTFGESWNDTIEARQVD